MVETWTLFYLAVGNLVTPGLDIRTQTQTRLSETECILRRDAMRITWAGHYIAYCQKD